MNDLIFSSEVLNFPFQPGMSEDSDVEQGQLLSLTFSNSNENIIEPLRKNCGITSLYTLNKVLAVLPQYSTGNAIGKAIEKCLSIGYPDLMG